MARVRFSQERLHKYFADQYDKIALDVREDANESLAFARELEHFVGEVYDLELLELNALSLFPADTPANVADTSYTTRQMSQTGKASFISDWTTDLESVSYDAKGENNYPIKSFGNQYVFTIQDIRTAQKLGVGLDSKLAEVAKRAHAETWEHIAWFGDDESGVKGMFDSAEFIANGTAKTGAAWDTLSGSALVDAVLTDFANMWKKLAVDTNYKYLPDTWVLPVEQMALLAEPRALGTGNGYGSILELILATYGKMGLKDIVVSPKLNIGTTGAAGGLPRNVLYKKDAKVVAHQTPIFFEQILPQAKGFAIVVPCHSRMGGVHVEKPKGATFMDGCST